MQGTATFKPYTFCEGKYVLECIFCAPSGNPNPGAFGYMMRVKTAKTVISSWGEPLRIGSTIATWRIGTPDYSNFLSCCGLGQICSLEGGGAPEDDLDEIAEAMLYYLYRHQS